MRGRAGAGVQRGRERKEMVGKHAGRQSGRQRRAGGGRGETVMILDVFDRGSC